MSATPELATKTITIEAIAEVISTRFNIDKSKIIPEATFDDLGFDSLSQVDVALLLEKKLRFKITDAQLNEISTISDILVIANGNA